MKKLILLTVLALGAFAVHSEAARGPRPPIIIVVPPGPGLVSPK